MERAEIKRVFRHFANLTLQVALGTVVGGVHVLPSGAQLSEQPRLWVLGGCTSTF